MNRTEISSAIRIQVDLFNGDEFTMARCIAQEMADNLCQTGTERKTFLDAALGEGWESK